MSPFNTKEYPYLFLFFLFFIFAGCGEESNKENEIDRFTVQSATFSEGDSNTIAEIRVTLEGSLVSDVTVPFEFEERTASIGDDFNPTGGELTFSPDNLEASVPVEIVGDEHFEISESFTLRLTANGQPTNFTITINDNDEMAEILSDEDGFYTPEEYPSMSLKWSDEFNGDQLNTGEWTYEVGDGCPDLCQWGNRELQDYTDVDSNSNVENGMLTITARKDGSDYTSARIKTENKIELQYGRIDVRAKLPKGQGIWPAIWMLGANIDQVGWPMSGEIDIMELVGHEPSIVHGTVHYDDDGYDSSSSMKGLSEGTYSDQFHVYTLVWEKDEIRWYVDNQWFKTFSTSDVNFYPFNAPFFFIMNIAVGGNWPGPPDQTTEFPQEMVVDYIRVFE
ncbi:MAG: family 16 glycosylhydrolase [Balneolaceae bacterium]|nr:family 16 glycosylhydrolase [Balneolaceae bacterium]